MNNRCFYTSFNRAYTPQALILAESLRNVYGNTVDIVALLVDDLDSKEKGYFAPFDHVWQAEELGIPDFKRWIFGLDIVEAATAVKPFALCRLLEIYEEVVYLDPDTIVYTPLDEMFDALATSNLVLTPHQTMPSDEEWVIESTELQSLTFGVFNLGFVAVRKSPLGLRVAQWWRDRCYKYCVDDTSKSLFTDQKLFDLAPAFFPGMHVLTHPGYNVATWNLRERALTFDECKGALANGLPLRFCHFTKATHIGALALERMSKDFGLMGELFYAYLAQLEQKKAELLELSTDWHYGRFADGEPIQQAVRRHFRESGNKDIADPFASRYQVQSLVDSVLANKS